MSLVEIKLSSFYLLSCNASTKSPGAGHSSNNALDRFHFPRLPTHLKPGSAFQHLSPSSCAASHFIFSQQNFSAPSVAPGHVHEAHAVCAVAARTVLARQPSLVYRLLSRLRTLNIPPHPLVNSACAPPHLPLFTSRAISLPNPSQSIQVNCSGVGSRELPPDHCRHIWAVVARSLQAANLMPLLPQSIKDVKKERDAKEKNPPTLISPHLSYQSIIIHSNHLASVSPNKKFTDLC